jgi:uncharacterized protein YjbJ (UPF0337 family)
MMSRDRSDVRFTPRSRHRRRSGDVHQSVAPEVVVGKTRALMFPEERQRNSPVISYLIPAKEHDMDREHVKGAADKAKGAVKEGAGKLTGDKRMENEGKIDKAKGSAHKAAGDVKDAARDAADAIKK